MARSENQGAGRFYEHLGYAINPVVSFGKRLDGSQRVPALIRA
jgi:hypothetical protein